jgi:hypothetical protein
MKHTLSALAFVLFLASCGGGGSSSNNVPDTGPGTGTLTIQVTDAPFLYEMVTLAHVSIDKVTVHTNAGAEAGFITVYEGPPILVNLLALHDGVVAQLAQAELPTGSYRQVRLRVVSALLAMSNGNTYSTANDNLHLTSQSTSGFKVFVDPPIEIEDGISRTLLLDFDLTQTFHPIPANDPMSASAFQLQPVIHATNLSTTGEIRGLVTQSRPAEPVVGATVYILPQDETDVSDAVATTTTSNDGTYSQLGLVPGTYDVLAVKGTLQARVNDLEVSVGTFTQADLHLR